MLGHHKKIVSMSRLRCGIDTRSDRPQGASATKPAINFTASYDYAEALRSCSAPSLLSRHGLGRTEGEQDVSSKPRVPVRAALVSRQLLPTARLGRSSPPSMQGLVSTQGREKKKPLIHQADTPSCGTLRKRRAPQHTHKRTLIDKFGRESVQACRPPNTESVARPLPGKGHCCFSRHLRS